MRLRLQISLLGALCTLATAQDSADIPGATKVVITATKRIGVLGPIASTNVQCDSAGNIYLPFNLPDKEPRISYLLEFSADGQKQATFYNGIEGWVLGAEAVGLNGEVVMLPNSRNPHVLRFAPDGTLESRVEFLDAGVGTHLALFPNGNVLVTSRHVMGTNDPKAHAVKGLTEHMVTGIYDHEAHLVKRLEMPDDPDIERAFANHDWPYFDPIYPQINYAIDLGAAAAGPDGNVYLMRYGDPAFIYAIDPTGAVLRRLEFKPPMAGMKPYNMQVKHGMILLFYRDNSQRALLIANWETGEPIKLYDVSTLDGVWSCYDPSSERVTFMRSSHNVISMIYAQPVFSAASEKSH